MSELGLFLLVEDNENDVLLVQRAFLQAQLLNPLIAVPDAHEAMAYFMGIGRYRDRTEFPLPDLVLLDLKLPGMDGFEFLKWLRQQSGFGHTRVVVLTASDSMEDVNRAYEAGANSFLVKPMDFEKFVEISRALNGYWLWMDAAPETFRPTSEQSSGADPAPSPARQISPGPDPSTAPKERRL